MAVARPTAVRARRISARINCDAGTPRKGEPPVSTFWMLDAARNPIGPFDDQSLRRLADEGKLAPNDLVCDTEGGGWVAASSVRPTFFRSMPAPPPPPPIQQRQPLPPQHTGQVDPALGMLVPVGVDPMALIAGYVGLFSIVLVPAPVALLLGLMALGRLKADPKARGAGRAWFAVIAGVIGSLGLLLLIVAQFIR